MTHNELLGSFFTYKKENEIHKQLLEENYFEVPVEQMKDFMVQLTDISLVEVFNYLDNHPLSSNVKTRDVTECGALAACTKELCEVLYEKGTQGMTVMEVGKSKIFSKYLRVPSKSSWSRYGSQQVKTAEQLGLSFKQSHKWYLSCYGYVYAFCGLTEQRQRSFLCRALLRKTFYAQILTRIRTEEVHLSSLMHDLSPSTQGRRSSSVLKMLDLCFSEMDREGIKWNDLYVPRYRPKTRTLVEQVMKGTRRTSDAYTTCDEYFVGGVPLYSVKAACGYFDTHEVPEQDGWIDVSPSGVKANEKEYFVVHAKGNSMLPKIKDGDLCLFKWYKGEPLQDKIVLTQCRDYDNDYESSYTIKRFHQPEVVAGQPKIVSLEPLNKNNYNTIQLSEEDGCDYQTVGIFVKVLAG